KSPEFNGAEFKAMLKNLEKFVSIGRKLPCPDLYDVVEGFIKISMECAEIFQLLEGEKHTENEMLVFESLEVILLRTASDLSHFNMVGNGIVKKIVANHMKLLQGSLHSANHFVRHCLNLLSAMVSQGVEAAREVFSHIHIKALSGLEKRGRPDVRLAFIQFVLSFLVSGDGAIIGQLLEVKLPHILSTGLKEDRMSTVNLILSTLKTRVVLNKAISKTQKVRFFTPVLLGNIASLYRWNGIPDATTDDGEELVHRFLLDLCCSRKHGINFHDPHFGTAGVGNLVLLQFLVGLKQATEDELVAELVVNVLKNSPDILSRYFKETQYSYTPRPKSAWQDNVNLLKKQIYEAQPEISTIFQTCEAIPVTRLISMIMVISLPPICNKTFFTQGLCLANQKVQLTTVSVMNFILKRASKNIEYLLDKTAWERSDVYSAEVMEQLVQQYREALGKILPDMTTIISTWQSLSKKEKAELIFLGIVSEKGMKEEVPPVLQYQILQLALDLPASKFSWFRIQEAAESAEKSVLYLLLKMFVNSSKSHLRSSTQKLVIKVLQDTGVFEHTWMELELWLNQLDRVEPSQQETVIQFLERQVFVKLVCNSYEYTDKVASLVQEAAYLQANLSSQEGDTGSLPVSHIDVLDMLDIIMEGSEGEMEEFGPALSEELIIQTFPFSAVVPAALEARNKEVCKYLSAVLSDVLHCQRDPLPFCLALLHYDKELVSSGLPASTHPSVIHLHQYYSSWLPQQSREELIVVAALGSILKHPCLEQWFLALELSALPPHSLKPVRLKQLCALITDDTLTLLKIGAPVLKDLCRPELLSGYTSSIKRAVLKELLQTLSREPGCAKLMHTDVFSHCLREPRPDFLAISSLLLRNCSAHRLCFELWCLEPANMAKLSSETEAFLPLINTYLQVASREDPARPKDQKEVLKALKQAFLEKWKLVDVITDKLVDDSEEQEKWRKSVCVAALKCLTAQSSAEDIPASEWNSFVKNGLYRYRDSSFLNTLSSLLTVMYAEEKVQKDFIPLSTLHLMISSHSQFLPTMLALVSLLLCVVKKCPKVCNISHFVVLLGAYGATLSTSQKLLLLLQEYEKNQVSLLKFAFLWGPAAVEHHKTRKSLGASLWKQASSDDLLALLKTDRMLQTISQFPQQRTIILQLYDPRFLLPLFSVILRPECVVDCLKFISSHALGFTVMALSSYDPKVRAAAYHVLGSFYHHLEGARFREKRQQMLYLMDMVKNGIQQQNQKLPFVLTSYIAKVAQQMLRPDHMYVVLNKFLLSQQSLDLKRVPEFFKLFYSFDLELQHKMEREWILSVLEEGISDGHCFELCNQQGLFQSLLGFSSSPLCDETFKLLCSIVDLLCVLWFTNLGEKEKKNEGVSTSSSTVKCLPLPFINEFLSAASAVCRHLLGVKAAQLNMFVQMLSTALMHRGTALNVNKQADWLTLRPQPLSSAETLTLLLCWASLSRNAALLSQIQALSDRHKVTELMAGLFLVSMFIHELWSGAASAELFLSYVRSVTRSV
uniref:URB1 ribosome biogenesis homolog n=1 Tax=Oryzias melastigma TaxID=30732 RepID=A0A3B3CZ91_ORYME